VQKSDRLLAEAKQPSRRAVKRGTLSSQPWLCPAVAFAAHAGARRGEALAVKWSGLDLDERYQERDAAAAASSASWLRRRKEPM
jgi:hypothetical protein